MQKPIAAFAAKNCAVTEQSRPTAARARSKSPILIMKLLLLPSMPLSIIAATMSGTKSSNVASKSLKSGARMHSFRNFFMYIKSFFIFTSTFAFSFCGRRCIPTAQCGCIRLRGGIVPYLKHYTAKSRLFPYRMRQCRKINSIRAEIDKIKPCECCK